MSNDQIPKAERPAHQSDAQLDFQGFELAKAIRGEVFGYLVKLAIGLVGVLGVALATMIYAYIEWRLPKLAGGVPRGAVMAFEEENCPEGWTNFDRGEMRVIVGAVPNKVITDGEYPRRLHFNEQRGDFAEYLVPRVPAHERPSEAERPVMVPGFLALTVCEKAHEE